MQQLPYTPMRSLPSDADYGSNDVLVVFGEVFGKGYVNGIVEEAARRGMKIIGSTVGRRDSEVGLRALTDEELAQSKALAPFTHYINRPLEAGFDMEKSLKGRSPCDQLKGVKMDEWDQIPIDWEEIQQSEAAGQARFVAQVRAWMKDLQPHLVGVRKVLFAHTMAGGVPRAKIMMPTMNKIFKGRGDRHLSSEKFWKSSLGRVCEKTFNAVTADTFRVLLEETAGVRAAQECVYVAYGYHGTEILTSATGDYTWQTYAPYVQGWAKMRLEGIAREYSAKGVKATVYNCPEILTNSSNLFNGVELPLYPFLSALQREAKAMGLMGVWGKIESHAQSLMKEGVSLSSQVQKSQAFFQNSIMTPLREYSGFPQHNWPTQMDLMLQSADEIQEGEADGSREMMLYLSRLIFDATGRLMLADSAKPVVPVSWLGHDILAKCILKSLA